MSLRRSRLLAGVCTTTLVLGVVPAVLAPVAHADTAGGLPARARHQIEALAAAKAARTPAEDKLDSALLTKVQQRGGRGLPGGVRVASALAVDHADRVSVDIRGTVTPGLVRRIGSLGGVVQRSSAADGVIRADLPVAAATTLSALPQVRRISSLSASAQTDRVGAPAPLDKQQRDAVLQRRLRSTLAGPRSSSRGSSSDSTTQGVVVSEGDRAHGADVARSQRHVSGIGVTVGVLSDGIDSVDTSIATGELPVGTHALAGAAGSGDEGTAMLEVVHDLAPKASLLFATAADGVDGFAANIRALRAAGADVIVDDYRYFAESPFQDGPIAQAVSDVTHDGAVYVSSAGNDGNLDDGTSGTYEADFRSSGQAVGAGAGSAHDFDPGAGVQLVDPLSAGSVDAPVVLTWADALGHASDDYDLYALDAAGNVVAFSDTRQDGDDDPTEILINPPVDGGGTRLVVVKYAGADRYFRLSALRGRFVGGGSLRAYATAAATLGHSSVPAVISVAAVPAASPLPVEIEPGDPASPAGPYPGRYTRSQLSERFTSDGPRRIFFSPSGRPLTPGDVSATGGQVRRKPSLAAADGVSTSVPGFDVFFGTSASAPHAAALAALVLSGHPGLSPVAVRRALARSALDLERAGADRDTGAGVVDAPALLRIARAAGQPYAEAGQPVVLTSSDGDAYLESGEWARVEVPVHNAGDVTATRVRVQLRTTTPGVRIGTAVRRYGSVRADGTASRTFTVRAPASLPAGSRLALSARVRFRGAFSPRSATSRLPVGEPSATVIDATYAGPAAAIPDLDPAGVSVPLEVRGVGPVSGLTFSIDGTTCSTDAGSTTVGIDHTYDADLAGVLTSPDGTAVRLFNRVGAGGHNFCRTVFSDTATRGIQDVLAEEAPFSGTFTPEQPLAAFTGRPADGTWRFSVSDAAPADVGSIRAVSLHVRGFAAPPR